MIDVEKEKNKYFIISAAVTIICFIASGIVASIDGSSTFRFFFFIIAIISIYQYLYRRLKNYIDITNNHEEVDSIIQEMLVKFDDNDKVRFSMIVNYTYKGNQYINKVKATNYEFEEFHPGDHIGLYVCPKNPKNAEIRIKDLPGYGCLAILGVSFLILVIYPLIRFVITNI